MADNDDRPPGEGGTATLLLTRPHAASLRFAAEARARLGAGDIVIAPLMDIVALDAKPALDAADGVILTSGNAVTLAAPGRGLRAWCVGARTTQAARAAGFDAVQAGEDAESLISRLLSERPHGRLLHLHGRHQRAEVAERLADAGLDVHGLAIYDQRALPPTPAFFAALAAPRVVVPLFSPRSATLFRNAAADADVRNGQSLVALSPAVRDNLGPSWAARCTVAARPDGGAMLDEIARRIYP